MTRTVLILAAGNSKRWKDTIWPADYPKQLLDIGGETLIGRVVRQVQMRGHDPLVVTHDYDIMQAVPGVTMVNPADRRWIMATVQSTAELWRGLVTVLYSDVLYSAAVIGAMLTELETPKFYGRWGDGFGFVFHACDQRWRDGIDAVLADAEQADPDNYEAGRNWELYRWLQGWDMHTHVGPNESNHLYEFVPHDDYTCDIDTPPAWEAVKRDVIEAGRLDEVREVV